MLKQLITGLELSATEVARRRQLVAERLIRESTAIRDADFHTIESRDLFELLVQYDDLFFDNQLTRTLDAPQHLLQFRLSSRMTSTGGMTTCRQPEAGGVKRQFEIAVSTTLLFNSDFRTAAGISVGGLVTPNRLDALQKIFEHELVHLLEMLVWDDSSCARPRFRSLIRRIFGHIESSHQLLTPAETARQRHGIRPGDRVCFQHQGVRKTGFVNRINRRATVLVPDPRGQLFSDDVRYQRFYVPIDQLTRIGNHPEAESA